MGYKKALYKVTDIHASDKRKSFYTSLGVFIGASVQVFMKEGKNMILIAGKTKIGFAGKASEEIELKSEENKH